MSGPFSVFAIGISSIMALAAIVAASDNVVDNSMMVQKTMEIQTQKHQEDLELIVSNDVLRVKNKGLETTVLKEIRVFSDTNTAIPVSKTYLSNPELGPLGVVEYLPAQLAVDSLSSKTVLGITDLGNVFAATNLDRLMANQTLGDGGNGQAMINGMGINSRIVQYDYTGKLNHGYGDSGNQKSLKTYNSVASITDYAAQILSSEPQITVAIPNFYREYAYHNVTQSLQETSALPNLLSYSQSKTIAGMGTVTQGPNGITFSGTGIIFVKLNDLGDQIITLEGDIPNGASLELAEFGGDLFALPSDTNYGFEVFSSPYTTHNGMTSPTWPQVCRTWNDPTTCTRVYGPYYANQFVYPNIQVSPDYRVERQGGAIASSNVLKTQSGSNFLITQVSEQFTAGTYVEVCNVSSPQGFCSSRYTSSTWGTTTGAPPTFLSGNVLIYDKLPIHTTDIAFPAAFQTQYQFPTGHQKYLIAKPNGNTFTIRGSPFDSAADAYLKITNLPPNTPYEIVKDGLVAASGMSQHDGSVILLYGDVNIAGETPSAIMRLFPDSLRYRGPFSTVIFDNVNHQVLRVDTSDDTVYVVHAYVRIPVVGDVVITDVYLDNALAIPYLSGNYTTGNSVKIPVIPGYHDINMKINGIPTTTVIAQVLGGTNLKVIEPSTSTITQYSDGNLIPSIESTTGSVSYAVATKEGAVATVLTATISGDSWIENRAYFGAPPPPPLAPAPKDPLKAWVDVYKNGILVRTQQIYFNSNPISQNLAGTTGSSSYVVDRYTYPQTVISGVVTTSVLPGDFVEFYVYASIHADGSTPPVPPGYVLYNYAGTGSATTTIHSGSILSS